jgi:hypothetical protein
MSIPSLTPRTPGSTSTTGPAPERRAPSVILDEIRGRLSELQALATPAALPGLHLSPAVCNAIEEITGLGTTRDATQLLAAIDRLASMRIGDIRIPFTPGQLAELQHRAQKRGRTIEQEMKAAVARIEDEIFHRGA